MYISKIGWQLAGKKKDCVDGGGFTKGVQSSPNDCARACKGTAGTHFTFGRSDGNYKGECWCLGTNGICTVKDLETFDLYAFSPNKGNVVFQIEYIDVNYSYVSCLFHDIFTAVYFLCLFVGVCQFFLFFITMILEHCRWVLAFVNRRNMGLGLYVLLTSTNSSFFQWFVNKV